MKGRVWTSEDTEMLRSRYPLESTRALAHALGRSYESVKSRATKLGLAKASRRPWTATEIALMRQRYPHEPTVALATSLGRPLHHVYQCAARLGLTKTDVYLASTDACRLRRGDNVGAAFRFQKGQTPPNKGIRRPGWAPGRMRDTQFKKGSLSDRAKKLLQPVGAERMSKDGYLERKLHNDIPDGVSREEANRLRARRWRAVHVIVWEEANGPLQRGQAIAFKNGDKTDIRLDNLECISRAELMKRNTVHNLPKPIVATIQLLGALNRQIRRRTKDATQKQDQRSS